MLKKFICLSPLKSGVGQRIVILMSCIVLAAILYPGSPALAQTSLRVKGDTVRVVNANLVIENPTKNVLGVLHNEGNGRTIFRKLQLQSIGDSAIAIAGHDTMKVSLKALQGKSVQFKVGVTNEYPLDGAAVYTNAAFVNRNLKIWRNGIFQYRDSLGGVSVDSVLGKISFFPPLAHGDRIYIEAIGGLDLVVAPMPAMVSTYRTLIDLGGDGIATVNGGGQPDGQLTASPDYAGKYWNNFTGAGGVEGFTALSTKNNLITTNNLATAMGISIIGKPQGTFGNSSTSSINYAGPTTQVGDYPVSAVRDNVFLESSINPNGGTIMRIRGLIPTNTYSIKLWGARIDNESNNSRTLEAKLSTQDWSESKSAACRYADGETLDYNRAVVFTNITGKDSVDINLRVKSGSTLAHVSLVDITITGSLPTLASGRLFNVSEEFFVAAPSNYMLPLVARHTSLSLNPLPVSQRKISFLNRTDFQEK